MLELFQTEWCPASRRIRQRLTELGLDYLNHQVPVEREERTVLFARCGSDTVPTLLAEDGMALVAASSGTTINRILDLFPPNGRDPTPLSAPDRLQRRDLLGGLIHEYEAA